LGDAVQRKIEPPSWVAAVAGLLVCSCNWSSDIVAGVLNSGSAPPPSDGGKQEAGKDATPEAGSMPEGGGTQHEGGLHEGGVVPPEAGDAMSEAGPPDSSLNEAGGPPDADKDSGLPPVNCEVDASFMLMQPIHRYRFSGLGSTIMDNASGANGTIEGTKTTELDGSGVYVLNRTHADSEKNFVNLPNGLISGLTDATFMVWFEWYGGAAYQRVFDFGMSGGGEGQSTGGTSYFGLSPVFDQGHLVAIFKTPSTGGEITIPDEGNLTGCPLDAGDCTTSVGKHFVAVVVQSGKQIDVYWDGPAGGKFAHWGRRTTNGALSEVDDRNNWLGRSQYPADWYLWGAYDEFRIYDQALPSCAIAKAHRAGPNSLEQ
jgi:hypothetical protein